MLIRTDGTFKVSYIYPFLFCKDYVLRHDMVVSPVHEKFAV